MGVLNVFRGCTFFALRLTFSALPGKPGTPICANKTEDSIQMYWDPPLNDGGKPVKGYIVDIREIGSEKWTQYVSPLNTLSLGNCLTVRMFSSVCSSVSYFPTRKFRLTLPFYANATMLRSPYGVSRPSVVCLSVCLSVTLLH